MLGSSHYVELLKPETLYIIDNWYDVVHTN